MAFDLSAFEVGDEFEGSPAYLGRVISAILAEGGTLDYEGASVVLTSLPNRKVEKATVVPEPVVPEPVVPEPVVPEPVVPEPVTPEPVIPEPVVPKIAAAKTKSYGRSRKSSPSS